MVLGFFGKIRLKAEQAVGEAQCNEAFPAWLGAQSRPARSDLNISAAEPRQWYFAPRVPRDTDVAKIPEAVVRSDAAPRDTAFKQMRFQFTPPLQRLIGEQNVFRYAEIRRR